MTILQIGLCLSDVLCLLSLVQPCSPFTYDVYVKSDISLSKGHLGSRGEASKNKLKDRNFNFSMANIMFFSIFYMLARTENIKLLD